VIAEATAPAIMYKTECPRGDLDPSYMVVLREELVLP
jgi:hypothetical protein